MTQSNINYPF